MATEIQYKVFKELYDEEEERYNALGTRSNLYLTIITFYLGIIVFKSDDLFKFVNTFQIPVGLFLGIGISLAVSLLLTALALGIHNYEGVCDPEEIIANFGNSPPSDDDFLDDRIIDLAVATNRNSRQNNRVATTLQWAAYSILVAVILQLVVFAFAVSHGRSLPPPGRSAAGDTRTQP